MLWTVLVFDCVKSCGYCHFIWLLSWQFNFLNISWWDHNYKRCAILLTGMLPSSRKEGKKTCMSPGLHVSYFFLFVPLISILLPLWEGCGSWFDNFMFVDLPVCLNSCVQIKFCSYCEYNCVLWSLSAFWFCHWTFSIKNIKPA